MNKIKKQSLTSTDRSNCIVTHYIKCAIEEWSKPVKVEPNKNRCVWDLEREG